jgi:seryl-tRNA synthetase
MRKGKLLKGHHHPAKVIFAANYPIMLQVNVLRNNTAEVKKRLAIKHFAQPELVDTIIALDDDRKKLQAEFDNTQAKVNAASKEIGKMMGRAKKKKPKRIKTDVADWKAMPGTIERKMAKVEKELQDTLVVLPNLPST